MLIYLVKGRIRLTSSERNLRPGPAVAQSAPPPPLLLALLLKSRTRSVCHLIAQVVEKWDQIPVGFLQHLDLRKSVYGYIGLEDYTLFPLIRPGSLVEIDANQRKISSEKWNTEFDRPLYFVELRNGYVCSWCQLDRGQLIVIPHPHSHQDVRRFDHPSQAEIVGRVTGVAMRIVSEKEPDAGEHSTGASR